MQAHKTIQITVQVLLLRPYFFVQNFGKHVREVIVKAVDFLDQLFLSGMEMLLLWGLLLRVPFIENTKTKPKSHYHIVSLTCHRDRVAYLLMKLSFEFFSQATHDFIVLDDGSLTAFDRNLFKLYGIVILPSISNEWQRKKYADLKYLFPQQEIIFLDSDILFYSYPKNLLQSHSLLYMSDYMSRYSLSHEEITYFMDIQPIERVNVGILRLNTSMLDINLYQFIEGCLLAVARSRNVEHYYIEQTVYSILFSQIARQSPKQIAVKELPVSYFLYARAIFNKEPIPAAPVCIHYTTFFRRQRIIDSLRLAIKTRFFTGE